MEISPETLKAALDAYLSSYHDPRDADGTYLSPDDNYEAQKLHFREVTLPKICEVAMAQHESKKTVNSDDYHYVKGILDCFANWTKLKRETGILPYKYAKYADDLLVKFHDVKNTNWLFELTSALYNVNLQVSRNHVDFKGINFEVQLQALDRAAKTLCRLKKINVIDESEQWLPIEDAPLNEYILGLRKDGAIHIVYISQIWDKKENSFNGLKYEVDQWQSLIDDERYGLTHFRLLPQPPKGI